MIITTARRKLPNPPRLDLNLNIELVDDMNILGVMVDSKLTFSNHITNIVKKCCRLLYLIKTLKQYKLDRISGRDLFVATCISRIISTQF